MSSDVLIVGGGVIGCAIAYQLTRRGVSATVVERDQIGVQASSVAAGMLAPVSESGRPGPLLELGLRSLACFPGLAAALREETGIDIELRASGSLRLAISEADELELRRAYKQQAQHGLPLEWLDAEAARQCEPLLAPAVRGALYCPEEQHVNSKRLVAALAQAAGRRGARFLQGTPVCGLLQSSGRVSGVRTPGDTLEAGAVVLAAGPWSGAFALPNEMQLPVTPKRGQLLHLHATPQRLQHIVSARHRYLVPRADGTIILGATEEEAGYDRRPTAAGVGYLLGMLPYLAPALALAELRAVEVGLRPWSADGQPLLGAVPNLKGLIVATGHGRNGILLSPITAELIARLIVDEVDEIPLACQADRFTQSDQTEEHANQHR